MTLFSCSERVTANINDVVDDVVFIKFCCLCFQFEYQQAQLEVEIENLSWKVERAETTDVADIRQQMNTTEVKRLTLLRDFVP